MEGANYSHVLAITTEAIVSFPYFVLEALVANKQQCKITLLHWTTV
jgi:hypothetical protein